MKCSSDFGLSFQVWSTVTVILEIVFSIISGGLGGWLLLDKVGNRATLLYTPDPEDNYITRNQRYEALVITWILVILLSLCIARIISAVILSIGVKKSSTNMAKFWIGFKVFAVMMSMFLLTASFTVPILVRVAAGLSLATDLITSYFIMILYPELNKMRKVIIVVDPKSKSPKLYQKLNQFRSTIYLQVYFYYIKLLLLLLYPLITLIHRTKESIIVCIYLSSPHT